MGKKGAPESAGISVFTVSRFLFLSVMVLISIVYTMDQYVLICHHICPPGNVTVLGLSTQIAHTFLRLRSRLWPQKEVEVR